tara:strand:- start:427 stop:978 length:552 start_codon:yes stop_codon:yes gene_type:complete
MPTLSEIKQRTTTSYYELVKIETSTEYRVTNAPFDVTYNSETYSAVGALLSIDEIENNMNFEVPKFTLQVNGLVELVNNEFFIETMLGLQYIDKPVTIFRSYFDQGVQIGTIEVFKGRIEGAQLNYDPSGGCSVGIEIASHWSTWDKTNGRFTNKNSQQFHFSTDTGLNNCEEVQKEILWKPA